MMRQMTPEEQARSFADFIRMCRETGSDICFVTAISPKAYPATMPDEAVAADINFTAQRQHIMMGRYPAIVAMVAPDPAKQSPVPWQKFAMKLVPLDELLNKK